MSKKLLENCAHFNTEQSLPTFLSSCFPASVRSKITFFSWLSKDNARRKHEHSATVASHVAVMHNIKNNKQTPRH